MGKCKGVGEKLMEFTVIYQLVIYQLCVTLGSLLPFLNLNFFLLKMRMIVITSHGYLEENASPGT